MRVRDGFLKAHLGDRDIVLPYGQRIADYCEGVTLNETGSILWAGVEQGTTTEELVQMLQDEYGLYGQEAALTEDVEQFQRYLINRGMMDSEEKEEYGWNPLYFSAGPVRGSYEGAGGGYERYFKKFACDSTEGEVDLTVQIACMPPRCHKNGVVILRNQEIILMDTGGEYLFLFPGFPVLTEMQVKKDGSYALLFCDADLIETCAEDIFHSIRFAFLLTASEKGLFLLHSASFLYQGKAWLFSGKSGTGKSSHTNLWKKYYHVELLNGDLNMMGIEEGSVRVYGQPWCGTSEICTEKTYPLGGITFLRQAQENVCYEPSESDRILAVVQRMISPTWDRRLMERNIVFAENVVKYCPVWRLDCRLEREAAEVMKRAVDHSLSFPASSFPSD